MSGLKQKKHRSRAVTIFLWGCLIAYLALLLKVILFKFDFDTIINILNDQDELKLSRINLVPFQTIRFYLFSGRVSDTIAFQNIVGNIVAFMPIGVLIPLLRRDLSLKFTFFFSLALSGAIEITQYLTGLGSCDIDDLILNVLGGMSVSLILLLLDVISFVILKILKASRKKSRKRS